LCERITTLTFHHLVPKKMHRRKRFKKRFTRQELNQGIDICPRCHKGLHKLYDEQTLAERLYTIQLLQADEAVARHCAWVAKQKY